jgi:aminoglycoside phosphotransferase (APT) family kinase protein
MPELQIKLEKYINTKLIADIKIQSMISLSGGACQDNYLVQIDKSLEYLGNESEFVFRTDKGASLFSSLSRAEEFLVSEIAFSFGVKTPRPILLETDSSILGNPFYLMQKIQGKATGRYIVKDPRLNQIRKNLPSILAQNMAKIHSIKPEHCENPELLKKLLGEVDTNSPKGVSQKAIADIRKESINLKEPHPAVELIINWLEENAPVTDEIVLVHGDFRTGNFMVTETEVTGIVDWEFAHFGDRHEDIAWLCMRDWRFGKNNKEVGGFADRKEFYEYYEKFSGTSFDPNKVLFWEVMGNLRWAIGSVAQAERHLSGSDKGIELASIGRRSCEMEMEAMRLIENAR